MTCLKILIKVTVKHPRLTVTRIIKTALKYFQKFLNPTNTILNFEKYKFELWKLLNYINKNVM